MSVSSIDELMVKETQHKVKQLMQELHENKHIDDMTKNGCFKHLARLEFQFSRLEEFQKHLREREDIPRI